MRSQNTRLGLLLAILIAGTCAQAQDKQYQRPKPKAAAPTNAKATPGKKGEAAPAKADDKSDKLDISDLEQKYWAPKDTDFSVVQNRTYTKAGKHAFTAMYGSLINDTFNEGATGIYKYNYYMDERQGFEFSYMATNPKDSDTVKKFQTLSGGGVKPDYNRDESLISLGYNFVPFYAKMSFMGSKILYFDMQVTPWIGSATYSQVADSGTGKDGNEETAFAYGIDITQYYFIDRWVALRLDYHNRWYTQDVLGYQTGNVVRDETKNTTMFLIGVTFFL